ncbi:zinc finger protein 395b isoform X1 [Tachysurus fulvidraco]|uniref:zinc finger protein 395b isoform X1 n=1 Tax=Tachysurus fulvidraco TaxID=1234273 RepID=UPI000F50CB90|nr:zinc finger protein 395b isoform X1 [Tachysurus fulvidraco]XP_027019200.1 zinc finger protein 395b isoform X1 [Tachysurus fulvidraco]
MAAVKSQAGTGAMHSATGRRKGGLVRHYDQEKGDIKKHRKNSDLRSPVGLREAWPASLEQTNTVLFLQSSRVHLPYRSRESVDMDEIMAAMVLTSLSCSPVIQSPTQRDSCPHDPLDMECGGGELSDGGSSGYWSWEQGSVSPVPSPSVTETDSSMGQLGDEGLHMEPELGAGDELESRWCKSLSREAYRCLWPSCGKVLTSRVGMKRHIRILHLSGAEQSHREEDFYYTEVSSEEEEPTPLSPSLSFTSAPWSSCSSTHSQPTSTEDMPSSSAFSQSAPSSVWQIYTEHLYQACAPNETITPDCPSSCDWTSVGLQLRPQISVSRSRSISVGEQWLQQSSVPTGSHTISTSPSRGHCSIRKGRGEAKKCRKVYGVERRDQWCTACRWKKACQRFPD